MSHAAYSGKKILSCLTLNLILGVLLGVSVFLNVIPLTVMAVRIKKCSAEQHCTNEAPSVQMNTQNSKFKFINWMMHVASLGLGIVLASKLLSCQGLYLYNSGEAVYTRTNAAYAIGRKAGRGRFIDESSSTKELTL